MNIGFSSKILPLLTFLNLSFFTVAGYHGTERSGATVSIPSYEDPVSFMIYLIAPAALSFFAVQQPVERKLEGKWRRDEPARKYSSLVAGLITLVMVVSPVFHGLPEMNQIAYLAVMMILGAIGLTGYSWEDINGKLPV